MQQAITIRNVSVWSSITELFKETVDGWVDDKAPRLGAALAYYTVFSLPPILIITTAIAGLVFGQDAAQNQIMREIGGLVGPDTAEAIQKIILSARHPATGIIATLSGLVVLMLGAVGVFVELQDALNTIWRVKPKPGRTLYYIFRDRWISFSMLVSTGFLLLVSMVISAASTAFSEYFEFLRVVWFIDFSVSFFLTTLLFAMIFKILPDVRMKWKYVWLGALVTAILFTAGKILIGLYLGKSAIASIWGAAGSVVMILVWIYYSSQIIFFGAEFIRAYMRRSGFPVVPTSNAVSID